MKIMKRLSIYVALFLSCSICMSVYAVSESCRTNTDYFLYAYGSDGITEFFLNGYKWRWYGPTEALVKHIKITPFIKARKNTIRILYNKDLSGFDFSLIEQCGKRRNEILDFNKRIDPAKKVDVSFSGNIEIDIIFNSVFSKNHIEELTTTDIEEIKNIISRNYSVFKNKGISAVRETCLIDNLNFKNQYLEISDEQAKNSLKFLEELDATLGAKLESPTEHGKVSLNIDGLKFYLFNNSVFVSSPVGKSMYLLTLKDGGSIGAGLYKFRKMNDGWNCVETKFE